MKTTSYSQELQASTTANRAEATLFTIGYEGISKEEYINILKDNSIAVLCDVRNNPFSRKAGFSKNRLKSACEEAGIKYIHMPQLGIESKLRSGITTDAQYDKLFDDFEKNTLYNNKEALILVKELIDTNKRVALTCYERDPKRCHRLRVANALQKLPGANFTLKHLATVF